MKAHLSLRGQIAARTGILQLAACALVSTLPLTAAGGGRYSITTARDLGMDTLLAINNSGQVMGSSNTGHLLFFDGTTTKDLGDGGQLGAYSTANDTGHTFLNDAGQMVVRLSVPSSTPLESFQIFFYSDGKLTPLASPGDRVPSGINSLGHVIWNEPAADLSGTVGILYREGVKIQLGDLGQAGVWTAAINRSDQTVGDAVTITNDLHAFLWQNGRIADMGTPTGADSYAEAINDEGIIAGKVDSGSPHQRSLFVYSAGQFANLGRLPGFEESLYSYSQVCGINNLGVIVGDSAARPYVWSGGKMTNLRDLVDLSGTTVESIGTPISINDRGQILVAAGFTNGTNGGCVLTPRSQSGEPAHLVNISARAGAGNGDQSCITGFVISGGTRSVLVRTIGPSLQQQGVSGFAANPSLKFFTGNTVVDSNDDWGLASNAADVAATIAAVGAFPLTTTSKDAALLENVPAGPHTVIANDPTGNSGVVLSEVYDAGTGGVGRLVNCSARVQVGSGDSIGILGFVVAGDGPVTVLLRAVGPGLASQGVSGYLANPLLRLHNAQQSLMGNDDWGTAANQPLLSSSTTQVGAFKLSDGSRDSALLVQLEAGAYTMTVSGADGGTGVALLEIYVVPPVGN